MTHRWSTIQRVLPIAVFVMLAALIPFAGVSAQGEQARVRIVHASPDAPAVDVAVAGGPILIENLAFPTASNYLPVDAGTYDLDVRPTGTETVAIDINGFKAEAGTIYTVFATGLAGDGSLGVLPLVDATNPSATTQQVPSMPATGAGGTATDGSGTAGWMIALGAVMFLSLAAGGLVLARRPASR